MKLAFWKHEKQWREVALVHEYRAIVTQTVGKGRNKSVKSGWVTVLAASKATAEAVAQDRAPQLAQQVGLLGPVTVKLVEGPFNRDDWQSHHAIGQLGRISVNPIFRFA